MRIAQTTLLVRSTIGAAALMAAATSAPAVAQSNDHAPIVVELFTSQSCSSCVAAAEYFGELAARDDIIALSWHVDYWNMLETKKGRWADPYSNAQCTKRQRTYNRNIRSRSSVYTPQMVINGANEAVGSAREVVDQIIADQRAVDRPVSVTAQNTGDEILFQIGKNTTEAEAFLVTLSPSTVTEVTRGENAGRLFNEVNIVTSIRSLGAVTGEGAQLSAKRPEDGSRCALLIQEPDQGRIVAATYCPSL